MSVICNKSINLYTLTQSVIDVLSIVYSYKILASFQKDASHAVRC